jgi:chromosome segregation ATPase
MKVSQLLFLALFSLVGPAIAQDEEHQQVDCEAVCASKVEETWMQANREIYELRDSVRAGNERLEHAHEQHVARDNLINELRGEIGGLREHILALEGAVGDGTRALATAKDESAQALGAESKKSAAAEAKLVTMQVELDAAKAEAAEFSSSRFLINVKVIQKDIKDFLKKMGLVKSDDSGDL